MEHLTLKMYHNITRRYS